MEESFNIDAPKCTALEADTLFYHHLMLACTYFEILPEDHEFNTLLFARVGRTSVWLQACQDFYDRLHKEYKEMEFY
jgi:hypothetical protein